MPATMPPDVRDERVDAHPWVRPPDAAHQPESGRCCCRTRWAASFRYCCAPNCRTRAAVVAPAEVSAIEIGLLVARAHVGSRDRRRAANAPGADVHANFLRRLLDDRLPRRDQMLTWVRSSTPPTARIEHGHLESVEEHSNLTEIAEVRRRRRGADPAGLVNRDARDARSAGRRG